MLIDNEPPDVPQMPFRCQVRGHGAFVEPLGDSFEVVSFADDLHADAKQELLRLPRSRGRFVDFGATCRLLLFAWRLRKPWASGIPGQSEV